MNGHLFDSQTGEPLIGATVVGQGPQESVTITDEKGAFRLSAPGASLVVYFNDRQWTNPITRCNDFVLRLPSGS